MQSGNPDDVRNKKHIDQPIKGEWAVVNTGHAASFNRRQGLRGRLVAINKPEVIDPPGLIPFNWEGYLSPTAFDVPATMTTSR